MRRRIGVVTAIGAAVALGAPVAADATPTWLAASPLSQSAAESADTAMGSGGSAAVAWLGAGAGDVVQVATRPPLGSFAPALDLSPVGENRSPQVAEDAAGDATVVWWSLGLSDLVEAATVTDGMPSAPLTLSAAGKEALFPAVAMNDRGDTIVAWTSREGSTAIVQASFRPAGGSFGAPVNISASRVSVESPKVAIDDAGDATVVWDRSSGAKELVEEATRSAATGSFSEPVVLSNESEPAIHPFAAMNAEGDTAVAWTASNGTVEMAQVAVRPAGGTFDKAVSVSTEAADAAFPQVALDGRGDPGVVWTLEFGGDLIVQYAAGTSSGTFPTVQDLAFESWAPSIAEDPAGDTLVSYGNALSYSAFAIVRPAGGRFGEPQEVSPAGQTVSPNGNSDEQGLNAAMDSNGDGAVGYTIQGSEDLPEVSLLDAGGPTLKNVSIPATATAGTPVSFSVAPVDQVDSTPGVSWAFGDASTASGDTVTHTFADPGTYSVSVTAEAAAGDFATHTGTITVVAPVPPAVPAFHAAALGSATVTADSHGRVHLAVACPAGGAACAGTVALTLPATASGLAVAARAQGTPVTVAAGDASFEAAAGASTTVSVALPTPVLQLLKRHHHLTLAVALESHGATGQSATTSGKVLVKAYAKPKRAKGKKKK
ncbi:MAG TPA: PKD domain-containing protein [Solirubrobacteraceae bacterium]|jgi:PKD repeat protein|nr:PKD domain-containing protein [Solirubrobacteraceae bacterium]